MLEEIIKRLISIFLGLFKIAFILLPIIFCLGIGWHMGQWYRGFGLPWWFPLLGAILFLSFAPGIGKWLKGILFWWKDESKDK